MELIEQIREKCVAVNPEIAEVCRGEDVRHYCPNCDNSFGRPIRLADVLLAIGRPALYDTSAYFLYKNGMAIWDLREDDLTKQSPETLAFIGKVLDITS